MATIEHTLQIVARVDIGAGQKNPVEVFVRAGTKLIDTGIRATDIEAAGQLVADKLAGRS
jgi:hypothetical protein